MHHWIKRGLVLIIAGLAMAQPLAGKTVQSSRTAITCNWPVSQFDSARDVLRRFGRQARMADIGIGEGETERGVVLYPNDPRRRIEILFWGPARHAPSSVRFSGEGALWTVWGIRLGDRLESVRQRNGRAFTLQQFGADYGGTLQSLEGGSLEPGQRLDCAPWMVFASAADAQYPESLTGDGTISSDHPDMGKARARVEILGLSFPPPMDQ